ncbi:MAG: PKD domain-containing protein [Bacteroidales bacterium]
MKVSNLFKVLLPTLLIIPFNACEDDRNNTDGVLTADAGANQTVEVGETVELNASQSTDATGGEFDIEWSFASLPDNSSTVIGNSDSEIASFTPDTPGEYVVLLTISNELGSSDDEVTITATEASEETQTLSGTYNEDLHLVNIHDDPEQADYLVTGNVRIDAELTIDPGVRIELQEDILFDISEDGLIKATGTASDGIVFTSADKDGNKYWKGLRIESTDSQNRLEYAVVEYAGNSEMNIGRFSSQNRQTNVGIDNDGVLSIVNSEISNSKGYGLVTRGTLHEHTSISYENNGQAGIYTHISNTEPIDEESLFLTNGFNGVEIYSSTLEQNTKWAKLNGDLGYKVSGDIEINAELSISEGVKVELTEDVFVDVTTEGVIMATGTEDSKITFTTAAPESGKYWKGLRIKSTDIRNSFDHVVFEYGGNTTMNIGPYSSHNRQTTVAIDEDARINITNSEFSNSRGYGLVARGVILEHSANTYADNTEPAIYTQVLNTGIFDDASLFSGNSHDGPQIYGSTLLEEITWSKLEVGAAYKISDDLEIEAPLFITEGTLIELDEDVLISIDEGSGGSTLDGYIDISGTESNPVVFSTSNLAGGQYWKGLRVSTSDARNNIENVVIEYAGNSNMNIGPYSSQNRATNLGVDDNSSLTISNSTIRNGKGWGIAAIDNANLAITNVQYQNNNEGDVADDL